MSPNLEKLTRIDEICKKYAAARAIVSERVSALEAELLDAKRRKVAGIKSAAATAQDLQSELRALIENSKDCFVKPKTMSFHGIKVGLTKGKGKIEWNDDAEVIRKIEKIFEGNEEMLEQLILIKKAPSAEGLEKLPAADLKKLGVTIVLAGEMVIVKAEDSEIDKLVTKLLSEGASKEEAAA